MKFIKFALVLVFTVVFAIACGQNATTPNTANVVATTNKPANAASPSPISVMTATDSAKGKDLYVTNCAACHKESGKGGKVTVEGKTMEPDDITTAKMAAKTDEKLTEYVVKGFPDDGMPAFKDKLTPDEIKAVVAHVRVLQKP